MLPDDAGREAEDIVSERGEDVAPAGTTVDHAAGVYRYHVPPEESVSEAVVTAVATATGRRPVGVPAPGEGETAALEPLYETVDPDALDALFRRVGAASSGTVSFTYGGNDVTVERGEVVTVTAR